MMRIEMRSLVMAVCIAASILGLLAASGKAGQRSSSDLPSAVITPMKIGPLVLGRATRAQVRSWAGVPFKTWRPGDAGPPVLFSDVLWEYRCPGATNGVPCASLFGFRNGRLVTFSSASRSLQTQRGTRVGTRLTRVMNSEVGRWYGFRVQCPGFVLEAPANRQFVAQIKGRTLRDAALRSFYLSVADRRRTYSACGS
jgi:hypothetical protein